MSKRSKADLLGLVDRIVKMYSEEKLTNKAIEKILREEGFDISRESIRLTVKTNKQIAKEIAKARLETDQIIAAIKDNPGTDIAEASLDFLMSKTFESIKKIDTIEIVSTKELSSLVKDLTNAKTKIAKLRISHQEIVKKVKDEIIAELQKALEGRPDLYEQLFTIVSNVEVPL